MTGVFSVTMLGRLEVRLDGRELAGLEARKVQELLCYLLLNRRRPHPREALASVLWGNTPTAQSRANLRKALWQLQGALGKALAADLIQAEPAWVAINPNAPVQLDIAEIEAAFARAQGLNGEQLDSGSATALTRAVTLYRGDLLEGWYQDWCLVERERIQGLYLSLLDKLMGHCEVWHNYEGGLAHGAELLRYDRAREQTYRRLMRLHWLAGDRTAALRQYERCAVMLAEELDTTPSAPTVALYERIRANLPVPCADEPEPPELPPDTRTLGELFRHLRQLQAAVAKISESIEADLRLIERVLGPPDRTLLDSNQEWTHPITKRDEGD